MTASERPVAAWLALSVLGAVGFCVASARASGGGLPHATQWIGGAIAFSLATLAVALLQWQARLMPRERVVEERHDVPSTSGDRLAASAELVDGVGALTRRTGLLRMLGGALGALGLAALFPLRSLAGRNPAATLGTTKWTAGARLVGEDGAPLRAADVDEGSVTTVYPEGFVGDADSQTVLIRLAPSLSATEATRAGATPEGFVAYSKVCTHAGCPVALYRNDIHALVCPCHQSVFDVRRGATPIAGPADRALPQLPLRREGAYLVARAPYPESVGPTWWDRR